MFVYHNIMKAIFYKILNFGITPNQSYSDQKAILLLNQITLALFFSEALVYPEFIISGNFKAIYIILTVQVFTVIPLILTYYNKTNIAKWFFNIAFTFIITGMICTHGWNLKADYTYLIFAITTILFFDKTWHQILMISFLIASYFFSKFYIHNFPQPYEGHVTIINSSVVFIGMIGATALVILKFRNESEQYEKSLQNAFKRLQEKQNEIEKQNNELEKINKELERFAYISSHNLKTPVRTIKSFADLMKRDLNRGKTEHLQEYLGFVQQGASQMQLLITDILEYSKFNKQNLIELSEVDLNKMIYFIYKQSQTISENQIALTTTNLPILYTNQTFLTAVFQNLIENSVKYNDNEIIEINIDYMLSNNKHVFKISDNGIGIDEKYFDKIFNMFERLHNSENYNGSGIGLAMSKKILERLNGEIWVESTVGKGSTFTIELPQENLD